MRGHASQWVYPFELNNCPFLGLDSHGEVHTSYISIIMYNKKDKERRENLAKAWSNTYRFFLIFCLAFDIVDFSCEL